MDLEAIRQSYISQGLSSLDASARTCQDVILELIAESPLAKNVTIKGGVVMQHLSGTTRRATQDLDFDFIRYSISDESIHEFIRIIRESEFMCDSPTTLEQLSTRSSISVFTRTSMWVKMSIVLISEALMAALLCSSIPKSKSWLRN
jgi:predicted nucleotidyltransferase component of viral defense system